MDDIRNDPNIKKWVQPLEKDEPEPPHSVGDGNTVGDPSPLKYDKPDHPVTIEELEYLSDNNTISDYKVEENRFGYMITIMFNDGEQLRIGHDYDGIYLKPALKRLGNRAKQIGSSVKAKKSEEKTQEQNNSGFSKFFDVEE